MAWLRWSFLASLSPREALTLKIQFSLALHLFSLAVQDSANIYLLEQSICRQQVPHSPASPLFRDEGQCKTPQIEARVAEIDGAYTLSRSVAIISSTVFYTIYIDRLGTTRVMFAGALSMLAESLFLLLLWFTPWLPPEGLLYAPLFSVVGGWSEMFMVLHYALLARHSEQHGLANNLFRLDLISRVASFVGSAATSLVLPSRILELYVFSIACLVFVAAVVYTFFNVNIPEHYHVVATSVSSHLDGDGVDGDLDPAEAPIMSAQNSKDVDPSDVQFPSVVNETVLYGSVGILCVISLAFPSHRLLLQWPSAILKWNLSSVAALDAFHVALNSAILYALPWIRARLALRLPSFSQKYPYGVDGLVTLLSVLGTAAGNFGISIAHSNAAFMSAMSVYDLSCIYIYSLRALMNVCAKQLEISESRVNIIYVTIFSTGTLVSTPVYLRMAAWAFGKQTSNPGMCFQVPALIDVLAAGVACGVFTRVGGQYQALTQCVEEQRDDYQRDTVDGESNNACEGHS